jgi:hypothetical protein
MECVVVDLTRDPLDQCLMERRIQWLYLGMYLICSALCCAAILVSSNSLQCEW